MNLFSGNPANLTALRGHSRIVTDGLLAAFEFPHLCDLYAPNSLTIAADKSVSDVSYPAGPTHAGVRCYYNATTNVNTPELAGNMKEANIFTDDRWYFDGNSDISTGWLIRMQSPDHPEYLSFWIAQGVPQVLSVPGCLMLPMAQVYAIITPKPAGVS